MTNIDLENLPFPMFETTEEEKEELREVLKIYPNHQGSWLCKYVGLSLQESIEGVLSRNGTCFLTAYIYDTCGGLGMTYEDFVDTFKYRLRIIWINKLLAYKGE